MLCGGSEFQAVFLKAAKTSGISLSFLSELYGCSSHTHCSLVPSPLAGAAFRLAAPRVCGFLVISKQFAEPAVGERCRKAAFERC